MTKRLAPYPAAKGPKAGPLEISSSRLYPGWQVPAAPLVRQEDRSSAPLRHSAFAESVHEGRAKFFACERAVRGAREVDGEVAQPPVRMSSTSAFESGAATASRTCPPLALPSRWAPRPWRPGRTGPGWP